LIEVVGVKAGQETETENSQEEERGQNPIGGLRPQASPLLGNHKSKTAPILSDLERRGGRSPRLRFSGSSFRQVCSSKFAASAGGRFTAPPPQKFREISEK
jgi:hypothetical protein